MDITSEILVQTKGPENGKKKKYKNGRACIRQDVGNLRCDFFLLDIRVLFDVVYPVLNI